MTKRNCLAALAALCVSFAFFSCAQLSSKGEVIPTASLSLSFSGDNIRAETGAGGGGRQSADDDQRATLTVTLSGGGYSATQTVYFTQGEWTNRQGGGITGGSDGNSNRQQVPFSNVPIGVPITIRASFLIPWDDKDPTKPYTGEETVTLYGDASVNIQLKRINSSGNVLEYPI